MQPYQLIQTVFAHDGPIRSVTYGPTENEIITGCQADAPSIRRWRLSKDLLQIEEIGSPIFHDHWVTALTSLKPSENLPPLLQKGCIISGCMDTKIRIFDLFNNLISTLEGHSKGVISFSWLSPTHLLSGSWDGLAILWDLNTLQQVRSFGPHENGVHVLGLSNGLIATTSTGESVNSQPANFHLRFWDPKTGQLVGNPIKDHIGPIRSIAALPGVGGFLTTSNDGSVIVRSIDGQVIETLMHPLQDDGTPPFVLDCNALGTEGGMDFVSSAEDGSVVVWQGTEMLQSIPHPNTIWVTLGLSETGEFVTGGQDGVLRIFSKQEAYKGQTAVEQLTQEFLAEVETAKQAKRNGPSAEDLAKAPKWENRGSTPGKSEHQIMVFNRDNSLIAAEWVSGSWVFVGEVTGQGGGNNPGNTITASDSGTINGVHYDHVFPVEIETSQGLKSLQLGFNNLENPFMAAQRFIDQNGIGQYYLQQIADWIIARGGGGASSPKPVPQPAGRGRPHTQSFESSQTGPLPAAVLPARYKLSYYVDGFAVFNDIPNITKVLNKLKEINQKLDELELKINENQFVFLEKLFVTLENTSYYHSSKISSEELITFITLLHKWSKSSSLTTVNNCFIFYDMMRLFVLHPYCIELFHQRQHYQHLQLYLDAVDSILLTIHNHNYDPATTVGHSVLVTMIKSFSNFLKNEITITSVILSNNNDGVIVNIRQLFSQIIIRFNHTFYFNYSLNKFNRLAMITLYHNLCNSLFIHKSISYVAWYSALNKMLTTPHLVTLLQNVLGVVTNEKEMLVIVFRGFQIVNTALQYVGTVSSYPGEAVENVVVRQIRSNDGRLALMNGNNYWKEKEKSLELMKCFEELIALQYQCQQDSSEHFDTEVDELMNQIKPYQFESV